MVAAKRRLGQKVGLITVLLSGLLAGCALGDTATPTSPPPLTLSAPPALRFEGSCEVNRVLETWLQITSRLVGEFQTRMNETAAKSARDTYEDVQYLASLRDAAFLAVAPDCGQNAQLILSDAMSRAVTAFQEFYNGQRTDVTGIIADVNGQMDQVIQVQNELTQRMEAQLSAVLTQAAPAAP